MNQDIVHLSTQVGELLRRHRVLRQEHIMLQHRYNKLENKHEMKAGRIRDLQKQLDAASAAISLPENEDKTVLKEYLAGLLEQIDLNIKLLS